MASMVEDEETNQGKEDGQDEAKLRKKETKFPFGLLAARGPSVVSSQGSKARARASC